ncbi:hypothetical protein ABH927_003630 [Planotetraspora sp. GP83]
MRQEPYPLQARFFLEAFGRLVAPAVFKTDEAEVLGLAGSIPVRLRLLRLLIEKGQFDTRGDTKGTHVAMVLL